MDFPHAELRILELLPLMLKPRRVSHSVSVAETAARLCLRFGMDPAMGRLAGLSHDIVKDRPASELWPLARRLGSHASTAPLLSILETMDSSLSFADKVVHGPAGAVFLLEEGLVDDASILGAVVSHSTARSGMTDLEKLIFSADKLEPLRKGTSAVEAEALLSLGLDELFSFALGSTIRWLREAGLPVAQATADLYNALQRGTDRA